MIAKIGKGSNLYGALAYNLLKVEKEQGRILFTNNIMETTNGNYSVRQLLKSFELNLIANRNTEKHTLHVSLNPDPNDEVNEEKFRQLAKDYMIQMGYGKQPFVVFKHTDIDRTHIHIVSVCVDKEGKKISDRFEKRRSMKVCRDLETKYGLISAIERKNQKKDAIFNPVDCTAGDVKNQIGSVVKHLPKYYQFQTLGTYNALLSLFNVTSEQVTGEIDGQAKQGLVYFALDSQGRKASNPFKSSLFGKDAGLTALQKHFEQSKEKMNASPARSLLKRAIETAMNVTTNEMDFKKMLVQHGINCVIRRNEAGRIYGITFIDHQSRTVWNGSQLSRQLSANTFNEFWNNNIKVKNFEPAVQHSKNSALDDSDLSLEKLHNLFDFLDDRQNYEDDLFSGLGGLLPESQGEDYEELDFANKIKRKRRTQKRS